MQNRVFHGYRIIETISTNNRYVVCKAYNNEDSIVVLKIARTEFITNNPEAVEKAFRMAEAMRTISRKYNPIHLVRVLDVVRTEKLFFIVMEYVEGVSLERTLPSMSLPRNQVDLDDIENQLTDTVCSIAGFGYTAATIYASNIIVTPRDTVVLLNYIDVMADDFTGPNVVDEFMDVCYNDISHYSDTPYYKNDAPYNDYRGDGHNYQYNSREQNTPYYDHRGEQSHSKTIIVGLAIIMILALTVILFLIIQNNSYSKALNVHHVEYSIHKEIIS